jgi:hypothetical protein
MIAFGTIFVRRRSNGLVWSHEPAEGGEGSQPTPLMNDGSHTHWVVPPYRIMVSLSLD